MKIFFLDDSTNITIQSQQVDTSIYTLNNTMCMSFARIHSLLIEYTELSK